MFLTCYSDPILLKFVQHIIYTGKNNVVSLIVITDKNKNIFGFLLFNLLVANVARNLERNMFEHVYAIKFV